MNLKNFESQIESKILARGKDYYKSGYIISLEYENGAWIAEVEGSEDYIVTVELSTQQDILDSHCDCPYDWGDYCKHLVAVFYAIREDGPQLLADKKAQKGGKKENFKDILASLDKEILIALITEYAKIYKPMKSEIEFRYSKKEDISKSARDVIRSSIKAVTHRGYVEYRDVAASTDGADAVLEMIEDKIDSNELLTAVSLGVIVAEEMMDLLDYCDDSNGYVGGAISQAIEKIRDAADAAKNHDDTKKIFNTIMTHALDPIYNGWTDWRMDLLSSLVPLCFDKESRAQLEECLSVQETQNASEWSRDYDFRQKQGILLDIITQFDGAKAAEKYVNNNLDNIDFRRVAIKQAIDNKDYNKAIKLCIDGEEENSRYPGIVKDMRILRYGAYEAAGMKDELKPLALELLLDGDFDYYLKYKSLHGKDEWISALYGVLEKTESNSVRGIYIQILLHEKHKPRILAYCNKFPSSIATYYTHLLPEYKNEVGILFANHIRQQAAGADSRSRYSEVCKLIKACDKVCPEAAHEVCVEILSNYAKRPAFMDEMRKIGKV